MMSEKAVEPVPALVKRPVAHKPAAPKVETVAVQPSVTVDAQGLNAVSQPPEAGVAVPGQSATLPGQTAPGQAALAAPLPQGQVYGDVGKPVRVVLRAREATRILVQGSNGRIIQNRMLKAGDSYRVPNFVGLTLTTSNAGAVQVELDGTVIGVAGSSQETAEAISLDPQSIMDRNNGNHGR
jgi:cytoskeleton protein RodZ